MRRVFLAGWICTALVGCGDRPAVASAEGPPAASADGAPSAAERVVQAQLDAYNRRDLDAFAATYTQDVRGLDYPDRPLFTGRQELRAIYGALFRSAPALRSTVLRRIAQGNVVIDHEEVTGTPSGETLRAVAIYEVRDGRIASVRIVQ